MEWLRRRSLKDVPVLVVRASHLGTHAAIANSPGVSNIYTTIPQDLQTQIDRYLNPAPPPLLASLKAAVIGQSAAHEKVLTRIARLLPGELPIDGVKIIFLRGEPGCGKTHIARAIAEIYGRPIAFRHVSVAGEREELSSSMLFGHIRGAYTGAVDNRSGVFEQAHGGVVFLDEIGGVARSVQSSLLQVLDDGSYTKLGEGAPRKFQGLVLVATNHNLEHAVELGRFDDALLSRLSKHVVYIPPLRDRPEDIVPLAQAIAERFSLRLDPTATGLIKTRSLQWNARELIGMIEAAEPYSHEGVIDIGAILSGQNDGAQSQAIPGSDIPDITDAMLSDPSRFLRKFELSLYKALYEKHGNWRTVATLFSIGPKALKERRNKLDGLLTDGESEPCS